LSLAPFRELNKAWLCYVIAHVVNLYNTPRPPPPQVRPRAQAENLFTYAKQTSELTQPPPPNFELHGGAPHDHGGHEAAKEVAPPIARMLVVLPIAFDKPGHALAKGPVAKRHRRR
jgi:hypothetical protein